MPTVIVSGDRDQVIHAPSGLKSGGSFKTEPAHVYVTIGLAVKRVPVGEPTTVTDEERAVLERAGLSVQVVT